MKPEEFLRSFLEIQGETIGERKKQLFILLLKFENANPTPKDIDDLISKLTPTTHLEESFRLDVLSKFKNLDALLDTLKGEKQNLIRKVLKFKWIFKGFGEKTPEFLIDLLMEVSFVTRCAILKNLGAHLKNEMQADAYHSAVLEKYGLQDANFVLPACSEELILKITEVYGTKVSERDFLKIIKKNVNFCKKYQQALAKNKVYTDWRPITNYLIINHIEIGKEFLSLSGELNKKATRKFFLAYKGEVVANPRKYAKHLKMSCVLRQLKGNFEEFYLNLFPKNIEEFSHSFQPRKWNNTKWDLNGCLYYSLQHLPKDVRFRLLSDSFLKVYKVHLHDQPDLISEEIIEMMPPSERVMWVWKKCEGDDDYNWLHLLPIEKSLKTIKEKIGLVADISTRGRYLRALLKTCKFNDDKVALLEVLQYFSSRHKNDDVRNRIAFMETLLESFDLELLSADHWSIINEIISMFKLKNEHFSDYTKFIEKYIHYLLFKDLPIKEQIINFIKEEGEKNYCLSFNIIKEVPLYEKKCLTVMGYVITDTFKEEKKLNKGIIAYVSALLDWNKRHPKEKFFLASFPYYVNSVKTMMETKPEVGSIFSELFFMRNEEMKQYNLQETFWKNLDKFRFDLENQLLLVMKYDPKSIKEHVKDILIVTWTPSSKFWRNCIYYQHLELPQEIVKIAMENVQCGEDVKSSFIAPLACLIPTLDYVKNFDKYTPSNTAVTSETKGSLYWIRYEIVKNFKSCLTKSDTLPTLLKYCKGDYLSTSLASLYYISYYVPEKKLQQFFNDLIERAVSVRKHAIFLTCIVSNAETITTLLKKCGESEKNPSICKFILHRSFKYFVKNPSEETWEIFTKNSNIIDKTDEEAYQIFFEYKKIPRGYKQRFIEFAWETLENSCEKIAKKKYTLISSISEELLEGFSEEFCFKILNESLFNAKYHDYSIVEFSVKFLFSSETVFSRRLNLIFSIFQSQVESNWLNIPGNLRVNATNFIEAICSRATEKSELQKLELVKSKWLEILQPKDAMEDFLLMQLSLIYIEIKDKENFVKEYAWKVSEFLDEFLADFGIETWPIFSRILNSTICNTFKLDGKVKEELLFDFLNSLMKCNTSQICFLLIINLLPKQISKNVDVKEMHLDVLEKFRQNVDVVVQIFFNCYLKELSAF